MVSAMLSGKHSNNSLVFPLKAKDIIIHSSGFPLTLPSFRPQQYFEKEQIQTKTLHANSYKMDESCTMGPAYWQPFSHVLEVPQV